MTHVETHVAVILYGSHSYRTATDYSMKVWFTISTCAYEQFLGRRNTATRASVRLFASREREE